MKAPDADLASAPPSPPPGKSVRQAPPWRPNTQAREQDPKHWLHQSSDVRRGCRGCAAPMQAAPQHGHRGTALPVALHRDTGELCRIIDRDMANPAPPWPARPRRQSALMPPRVGSPPRTGWQRSRASDASIRTNGPTPSPPAPKTDRTRPCDRSLSVPVHHRHSASATESPARRHTQPKRPHTPTRPNHNRNAHHPPCKAHRQKQATVRPAPNRATICLCQQSVRRTV